MNELRVEPEGEKWRRAFPLSLALQATRLSPSGPQVGGMLAKACISLWRPTHRGMPAAAAVLVALPLVWRLGPDLHAAARPPLLTEFSRSGSFDEGDLGIALVVSFLRLVPAHSPSYPRKRGIQSDRCHAPCSAGPDLRGATELAGRSRQVDLHHSHVRLCK